METTAIFDILKVVIGGIRVATAAQKNETIDAGLDIAETILDQVDAAKEVDSDIAERIEAFAAEIEAKREAGDDIDRDEFSEVASDIRKALNRWNAAG